MGFYLIRHPKGNILFDTGNNDRIINEPNYWGPLIGALDPERTPEVAIDAQLSRINIRPDDVRYVVVGHFHADHAGNVGKFPNSTWSTSATTSARPSGRRRATRPST